MGGAATDQNGSQVNFYYGAPAPYAESIAPSHHSTYAHYYDDEEDGWEMPNFYNDTRSNASLYGAVTKTIYTTDYEGMPIRAKSQIKVAMKQRVTVMDNKMPYNYH